MNGVKGLDSDHTALCTFKMDELSQLSDDKIIMIQVNNKWIPVSAERFQGKWGSSPFSSRTNHIWLIVMQGGPSKHLFCFLFLLITDCLNKAPQLTSKDA